MERAERKRVFVLEEEMLLALLIQMMLQELNYEVVGPPSDLFEGIRQATDEPIDLAVLDTNLVESYAYTIADVLRGRQIPFMFLSDIEPETMPASYADSIVLGKPFEMAELAAALNRLQWKTLPVLPIAPPNHI
jgi:DNA-binding response OmpR family regulator